MVPLKIWKGTVVLSRLCRTRRCHCGVNCRFWLRYQFWAQLFLQPLFLELKNIYMASIFVTPSIPQNPRVRAKQRPAPCGDGFTQRRNAAALELHVAVPQSFVWQGMAPSCVQWEHRDTSPNVIAEADIWCQHPGEGAGQHFCINALQATVKFCRYLEDFEGNTLIYL